MLELLKAPQDVFAVQIAGTITGKDLDAVTDRVEELISKPGKIQIYGGSGGIEGIELAQLSHRKLIRTFSLFNEMNLFDSVRGRRRSGSGCWSSLVWKARCSCFTRSRGAASALGQGVRLDAASELQPVVGDEYRLRPVDDQRRLRGDILNAQVRHLALQLIGAVDELDRGAVSRPPHHQVLVRIAQIMGFLRKRRSRGSRVLRPEEGGHCDQ